MKVLCWLLRHKFKFAGGAGPQRTENEETFSEIEVYECVRCRAWYHYYVLTGEKGPVTAE